MADDFIKGIVVPMLTPFNEDKSLDEKTLAVFTDWLCNKGLDILFPMGGSGEYSYLEIAERKRITDIVVEASQKRVPVVPGTGGTSVSETVELSLYAQQHGADGVSVVVPGFIEPNEDSIFEYYAAINNKLDIPIMIYDPKGSGKRSITPGLLKKMSDELKNIKAIKYRTPNGELMSKMIKEVGGKVAVLSGVEFVFLSDLAVGVKGLTGGGANIFPGLLKTIQKEFEAGNIDTARQAFFRVLDHNEILNIIKWPLSGKIALEAMGVPFKPVTRQKIGKYTVKAAATIQEYFGKI